MASIFQDVSPGYVFFRYAHTHSIITGYTCGTRCLEFRPGNNATRGQIANIAYLALPSKGNSTRNPP